MFERVVLMVWRKPPGLPEPLNQAGCGLTMMPLNRVAPIASITPVKSRVPPEEPPVLKSITLPGIERVGLALTVYRMARVPPEESPPETLKPP